MRFSFDVGHVVDHVPEISLVPPSVCAPWFYASCMALSFSFLAVLLGHVRKLSDSLAHVLSGQVRVGS